MHLSYSQINSYRLCPEYWRREKLEGEFLGLTTVSMSRGRGVHKGAEKNFVQKKDSHSDLPADDIVGAAVAEYETSLKADGFGLWFSPKEKGQGKKKVVGTEKDRTTRLANLFASDLAPGIQPDIVEAKGSVRITPELEVIGYIDVAQEDRIHDLKTSVRSKPAGDIHSNFQLTTYAGIYYSATGRWPKGLEMDVLVDTKTPKVQILETERDRADLDAWLSVVLSIYAAIRAGVFPPAPIGSWKCSPSWCPAWPSCKYVSRSVDRRLAGATK